MTSNLCTCGKAHDGWPSKDGSLLCQDCWEAECDKSWWQMVIAIDEYDSIQESSNGR